MFNMRVVSSQTRFVLSWQFQLLKRFFPLWLPLLLIWVLPISHEIARVNGAKEQSEMSADDVAGVVSWAESRPYDVGAALRAHFSGGDDYLNRKPIPSLDELEARFPEEKWLPAFRASKEPDLFMDSDTITVRDKDRSPALHQYLLQYAKGDPDNAFWFVALASWEWKCAARPLIPQRQVRIARWPNESSVTPATSPTSSALVPDDAPALRHVIRLLLASHHCSYYDDGVWQAARALAHTDAKRLGWSFERQMQELDNPSYDYYANSLVTQKFAVMYALNTLIFPPPSLAQQRKGMSLFSTSPVLNEMSPQKRLALGLSVAHIGYLVDEQKMALVTPSLTGSRPSGAWLSMGWTVGTRTIIFPSSQRAPLNASVFIRFARSQGFASIAGEAKVIADHIHQHDNLLNQFNTKPVIVKGRDGNVHNLCAGQMYFPPLAFEAASFCRGLLWATLSLGAIWLALNFVLWRAVGQSSTFQFRWSAACTVTVAATLVLWHIPFAPSTQSLWGIGLIVPPLILLCLFTTIRHHRSSFEAITYDRWQTFLLPPRFAIWLLPVALTVTLLVAYLGLAAELFYLTNHHSGFSTRWGAVPIWRFWKWVFLYSACFFCFLFLYNLLAWRFSENSMRPITHAGLRWFKETIGASVCVLVWLYLFVALAAWPARTQAKQMLNERWQSGDWTFIQKYANPT